MTTPTEALKLALEALELAAWYFPANTWVRTELEEKITAIKKALAQTEQEPPCLSPCGDINCAVLCKRHAAQPEQETVAFITPLMEQQLFDDWCPYKGNPDPRTVWSAAIDAVNGLIVGATPPQPKEPEQEPVGYTDPQTIRLLKDPTASGLVTDQLTRHKHDPIRGVQIPLYTSPPQRKPLTDEQAELLIENSDGRWCDGEFRIDGPDLMRLLKSAHGIKD